MATPGRFSQLRWLQAAVCLLALLGAGVTIGLGLLGYGQNPNTLLIVAGGFVFFLALISWTFVPLVLKIEANSYRQLDVVREIEATLLKQLQMLSEIAENTRISDSAKSLAHRDEEMEALRMAIRDNVRNERWEVAFGMAREIEQRFGYKEESDQLMDDLAAARGEAMESRLTEAMEMIERHFSQRAWDRAVREIDRLRAILPDDARVTTLGERLEQLRQQHKAELLREWDEAVGKNDTNHAIEVLKELDQYLTKEDVEKLQETARCVFKEKLVQLGIQFKFAVRERRWNDALETGLEIVRDFPNARMAQEVRDILDTLRARAHPQASAPAAG